MKNKSFFSQIMLLVITFLVCAILTVGIALFAGSCSTTLFDFQSFNIGNMIPILIIGGSISCVVLLIMLLFVSRSIFLKITENFINTNDNNRGNKK